MMVYSAPDVSCHFRKRVADEVMQAQDEDLEINTLKLKIMFESKFEAAATDGRLDQHLWDIFFSFCFRNVRNN